MLIFRLKARGHSGLQVQSQEGLSQGHSGCRRAQSVRNHRHLRSAHGFEIAEQFAVSFLTCPSSVSQTDVKAATALHASILTNAVTS